MKQTYEKLKEKRSYYHTLAFLIPFLTFIIGYIAYLYYPLGTQDILIVDAYHQYFQFFQVLRDKLIDGGSFFYTFRMGLGSDFLGLMAYYLMSPFNIFLIAIPEDFVIVYFEFLVALKIGLMGLTCSMYLYDIYGKKSYSMVVFSLIYSLSGFICGYYWNIMWLDVLILFPLVLLGLKKIVNRDSFRLYFFCLVGCFIINYYMSIFVVIGVILFYFGYSFLMGVKFKTFVKKGFKTLFYSIIAGLVSAFVLLPTAIGLSRVYKTPAAFTGEIKLINDFRDMFANGLAFNLSTVRDGLPNVYAGLIIFLFLFLYIFSKGITRREKAVGLFSLIFLYLSTNINILDYAWHGFRYSNMLPSRFTFILAFLVAIICYKTYENLETQNVKVVMPMGILSLLIIYYLGRQRDWKITVANLVLMTLYIVLVYVIVENKRYGKIILSTLMVMELIVNSGFGLYSGGSTNYYDFTENKDEIKRLQLTIPKDEFKRQESLDRFTFNDPALYGYDGLSLFSSTLDKRVSTFLQNMGHASSPIGNRIYYNYTTPVINGFLNIGYLFQKDEHVDIYGFREIDRLGAVRLLENEFALPLAFEPKGDLKRDDFKYEAVDNQENLFNIITGMEGKIFENVEKIDAIGDNMEIRDSVGDTTYFTLPSNGQGVLDLEYVAPEDGYYYFDSDSIKDYKFNISHLGEETEFDIRNKNIVGGLYFEKGDFFSANLKIKSDDQGKFKFRVLKLDEEKFEEGIKPIIENGAKNVKIHKEKVSFDINSESGNILTSIPYNEGWTCYVNGEKVDTSAFYDGFLLIDGVQGENHVELKYMPSGLILGFGISAMAVLVLLALKKDTIKKLIKKK